MTPDPAGTRRAGVLLHPTCLPGPAEQGVIGADALRFLEWLAAAGFRVWQVLPLVPVGDSLSPYQAASAFAGNPRLIDLATLEDAGRAAPGAGRLSGWEARQEALAEAWDRFLHTAAPEDWQDFRGYCEAQRDWLDPFVLFTAARSLHGGGWWEWPEDLRDRSPAALDELRGACASLIGRTCYEQYLFERQWSALREAAAARGIEIFGDVPIYVDRDSADVWWHREQFRLHPDGRPVAVAGVPPDYFSADGQLWGNPLYDWDRMRADGYGWWRSRFRRELSRCDFLRLDHFRALEAFWEVPADADTARHGVWRPGPADEFLQTIAEACGALPLVAEDLGTITPAVTALRDRFGLPGMLVLQFAFDGSPDNPYLPANHRERAVVYTGTHDNDTLIGWYAGLDEWTRGLVQQATGLPAGSLPLGLIGTALASPARLAMIPLQDLLGLDTEARMNTPGTSTGNWHWRFRWEELPPGAAEHWRQAITTAGR